MCFAPAWCTTSRARRRGRQRERGGHALRSAPARRGCRRRRAGAAGRRVRRSARQAAARRRSSSRSGLPVHAAMLAWPPRNASGKPSSRRSAPYASIRFARPGHRVRVVQRRAAGPLATPISAPGNDAKPPQPSTTSGRRRRMHRQRLDAGGDERERAEQQRLHALAAHAAEIERLELDAVLRHQRRLHAVARAEPEHARAARGELRRDREAGKHVSAGAAGGDHDGRRHSLVAAQQPAVLVVDAQQDRDRRRSSRRCRCRRTTAAAASGPWSAARPC